MTVDYRTRLTGPVASTDSNAFNQKGIGIIVTNILAIGNSFSQDASRYIHRIARADGVTLNITNLYIGGCPLERHFRNMRSDARDYSLDYNGEETKFKVSLKEALLNRSWDVVTVQQASHKSYDKESYLPYITSLIDYVKQLCPKAKIVIHQTWAYETGSAKILSTPFTDHFEMLKAVKQAYAEIAAEVSNEGIIPSGELMGYLLEHGVEKVHRDTFHASRGLGRYAMGLLWYRMLTGAEVKDNTFCDFDEPVEEAHIQLAKEFVDSCTPLF